MLSLIPWWVYLLVGLGLAGVPVTILLMRRNGSAKTLARAGLTDLGAMELPDFLRYLTTIFNGLGYTVERIPAKGGDPVADLVLVDSTGRRTAVSARHFKNAVDAPVVKQLAENAAQYRCKDALVVTTAKFSNAAIAAAEELGAILWDPADLADAMEKLQASPGFSQSRSEAAAAAASGGPAGLAAAPAQPQVQELDNGPKGPPCPYCGSPSVARMAVGKEIWLCSRFPRCNGAVLREKE
ncbi:MAG TPA: restriction endonuclease [Symbiobacteriaceae bacterium]|jgi:hypothetical protein|nr:restriction endonuclease [Symbiobacteriaceae bacterium]